MPLLESCFSSTDLSVPWRQSYLKALGLDERPKVERRSVQQNNNNGSSPCRFSVINLLPQKRSRMMGTDDDDDDDDRDDNNNKKNKPGTRTRTADPWMETAIGIQTNICEMADWIKQKQDDYISVKMAEEEASIIQSTVTSFTATTANEIESLHQILNNNGSTNNNNNSSSQQKQLQQHYSGIIQILMVSLKETIAEPFGRLQKYRHRPAVTYWQTPLQCRLKRIRQQQQPPPASLSGKANKSSTDNLDELLGLDDDGDDDFEQQQQQDQRFRPTRPCHRLHRDFLTTYQTPVRETRRPPSIFAEAVDTPPKFRVKPTEKVPVSKQQQQQQPKPLTENTMRSTYTPDDAAALQQEAVLLQATMHNDLDSVQQMEQTMVNITTLLSQFSNLVTEQQENIWDIHDNTKTTKDNLEQGQTNLIDAKERTDSSKHRMATAIFVMAMLLLLFHWLSS